MIVMLGKKESRKITVDGKEIELQPKPKRMGLFSRKGRVPKEKKSAQPASSYSQQLKKEVERQTSDKDLVKPTKMKLYIEKLGSKQKGLEAALRQQGIKESLYDFVKRMLIASIMLAIVLGITTIILMVHIGIAIGASILLGFAVGIVAFYVGLNTFLQFPKHKGQSNAKTIERDIIFAARDLIISLRSGMPLFNALTSVSTGYGEASKEFAKVVQRVQLGTPLVDAIDQTIEETKSDSFKRIMLQASVSIKSGADVVGALQSIIDQLAEERTIEMRRYGQKLNAIAMFYMLFGIILPSMGIAVVTILTTFISIFTVNITILEAALVGIIFLQLIFLQMIKRARPVFSM